MMAPPAGAVGEQLREHGGTLLAWLAVLLIHALVLLALSASRVGHAPPNKRMQLFWIPVGNDVPSPLSAGAARQSAGPDGAAPGLGSQQDPPAPGRMERLPAEAASTLQQGSEDAAGAPIPATADAGDPRVGIDQSRLQQPAIQQPVFPRAQVPRFDGGLGRARLPGGGVALVPGLVVREPISLDQRVQGVLALVGLGRIDPCPDIRRHVRSAIEARDPEEVSFWTDRERRCR